MYKKKKKRTLHINETLYKSYLVNVSVTKSARTIMGCHFFILDLKTSTLSQHFISDGTISQVFGPKYL